MSEGHLGVVRGTIAVAINIAVLLGLLILLGVLFGETHSAPHRASVNLTGVSALVWLVLALAYLIVPKVRTGQTLGRRLVGGRPSR